VRILGIDPGLATVGLGLIEATGPQTCTAIDWWAIRTASSLTLPERLGEITTDLRAILVEATPALAVVERVFFAVNEQSAIDVAQARGAIIATLTEAGIRVLEVTPMQLKHAITGDGSADKLQVQTMVQRLLQLDALPRPVDCADALGLALYGALAGNSALA
jgi:crossover junction endodeoxyribonuclease RuvC